MRRVADLVLPAGPSTPSPSAWEDEVLYFLLVDRFDDGRDRPLFTPADAGNAVGSEADAAAWRAV